jgi:hypothetical protein
VLNGIAVHLKELFFDFHGVAVGAERAGVGIFDERRGERVFALRERAGFEFGAELAREIAGDFGRR